MRLAHLCLGLSAALFLAACGDDGGGPMPPEPLEITSLSPAAGAAGVETGATVAVVFTQAIDPVTLTAATFQVKRAGAPLAAALSYEAATRTSRAAVPLLPGVTYEAQVTTGLRTPADAALSASQVWSFTTRPWEGIRPWEGVTVDAGGWYYTGTSTSMAVDAGGRLHVSYSGGNADLKYATCPASCRDAANWQAATVDETGNVGFNTSLVVDAGGRLHISYHDNSNLDLKYATCAASCEVAANWQAATVDAAGLVGQYTSLAVDAGGRLHVSYYDETNGDLKYTTCATSCEAAANWQAAIVDAGGNVGQFTSLRVDAGGRLHVSYMDITNGDLKYATCAASCAVATNWQAATVDAAGNVGVNTSLAVGAGGRLHVSYGDDSNFDLKYATCAATCDVGSNWQAATVDAAEFVGEYSSLAVDAGGRVHVGYFDQTSSGGGLKYATCAASCEVVANWQAAKVDPTGFVGAHTSLVLGARGRVHVSYFGQPGLIYIE